VLGALHQVIPDKVMAGAGSPLWAVAQTGTRDDGRPYTNVLFFNGGMGATTVKDGEHVLSWPSNISSTPVEIAERNSPLFFRHKRMRPGSGGPGRFRGGLGQDVLFESRSRRPIVLSFMAERTRFPAPALAGAAGRAAQDRGRAARGRSRAPRRPAHQCRRAHAALRAVPSRGAPHPALSPEGRGRSAVIFKPVRELAALVSARKISPVEL